jgi:hypothetical protein
MLPQGMCGSDRSPVLLLSPVLTEPGSRCLRICKFPRFLVSPAWVEPTPILPRVSSPNTSRFERTLIATSFQTWTSTSFSAFANNSSLGYPHAVGVVAAVRPVHEAESDQ